MIHTHLPSCITATLTPSIYASVLQFHYCSDVWISLQKRFTTLSQSHIHQLKNKLNNVAKKSNTMEEYLSKIKDLVGQLALASVIIEDEDLVLITLNGLPSEYDSFATAICAQPDIITMDDLSVLLCSEAIYLEFKLKRSTESTVALS